MTRDICPICNNKAHLNYDLRDVFLYYCQNCEHRFSIIKSNCEETYDDSYYLAKHRNWFENPDTELYDTIVEHIKESKSRSILDVCCGNGNVLKSIRSQVY